MKCYVSVQVTYLLDRKIKDEETASKTSNAWLAEIRIESFIGGGAVYPGRITRGGN